MDQDDVLGELGGFALGEVLHELDLDAGAVDEIRGRLGYSRANKSKLSRDSLYSSKFADGSYDGGQRGRDDEDDDREDYEAQVDQEMHDEKYLRKGQASLVRGEQDDFDDDDDEPVRIKDEPVDAVPDLFAPGQLILPTASTSTAPAAAAAAQDRMQLDSPPAAILSQQQQSRKDKQRKDKDVRTLFPQFEKGKVLDFTDMLAGRPRKKRKVLHEPMQLALPPSDQVPKRKSTKDVYYQPLRPRDLEHRQSLIRSIANQDQFLQDDDWESEPDEDEALIQAIARSNALLKNKWTVQFDKRAFSAPEVDDWEDKIIWSRDSLDVLPPSGPSIKSHPNVEFERGEWTKSIVWDARAPFKPFSQVDLNLNDPNMLLQVSAAKGVENDQPAGPTSGSQREAGLDRYNLSNDKEYEDTIETKKVIRQTFGLLEVSHSYPAQKLQLPFYKLRLTKADQRAWHRPPLTFPTNVPLSFTKVRSLKKKKDANGRRIKMTDGESYRSMVDITCRDTGAFTLFEYSEETPPIISNIGMGSIVVNYYRKKDAADDFIPNVDIGQPLLLEPTDESPFKAFGTVPPGETVPALYNNLVRAPLFRHKPNTTDFLVVRSNINGEIKYYLRDIKSIFVVGQTYPQIDVPSPPSRRNITLLKNRLQQIVFRLTNKEKGHRIHVHRVIRYFPDHTELQMRQRLKEFMEFNRKGDSHGYWTVKPTVNIPDAYEMLKMATPEQVCLNESMQVGLRHLQDAGYAQAEEGGQGDDDSKLDTEQQLAPWITTKNFINACLNKAMLKLHGEGDPTGRGEAFSFLRTSMKDIFLRANEIMADRMAEVASRPKSAHKYNVQEQQDIYREEIARIWKAQKDSLSNPRPPELTREDEERARGRGKKLGWASVGQAATSSSAGRAGTPAGASRADSPASRASSVDRDDATSQGSRAFDRQRVLRVKRLVDGKWETEIVKDPQVIAAYVRQRQMIEEDATEADDLLPSDDEGKNERRRKKLKEQLEKLKRNQERRLARKQGNKGGTIYGPDGKKIKTETTRVCSNCGQRGHMKTSRALCPRWHEFNAPKAAQPSKALPTNFGGSGLAIPTLGSTASAGASGSSAQANAGSKAGTPKGGSPNKPSIKLKFGTGSAQSPPPGAAPTPPAGSPPAPSQ